MIRFSNLLPESSSGDWSIRHQNSAWGKSVRLYEGENEWMNDEDMEWEKHEKLLAGFAGRVLVGGLGIGMAVFMLAQRQEVISIIVVEKSSDVRVLVEPYISHLWQGKVNVVEADLFDYLASTRDRFDCGYYDVTDFCPDPYADRDRLQQLSVGVVEHVVFYV